MPGQLQRLNEISITLDRWQREAAGPEFAAKAANKNPMAALVTAGTGTSC